MKKLMTLLILMINLLAFTSCNNDVTDPTTTNNGFERGWWVEFKSDNGSIYTSTTKIYYFFNSKKECKRIIEEINNNPNNIIDSLNNNEKEGSINFDDLLYSINMMNSYCPNLYIFKKASKSELEQLEWYIEPNFEEDDLVFEKGWWKIGDKYPSKISYTDENGVKYENEDYYYGFYILYNSKNDVEKAFDYSIHGNKFICRDIFADKSITLESDYFYFDTILNQVTFTEPYYSYTGDLINNPIKEKNDWYFKKISEEDLPQDIKKLL